MTDQVRKPPATGYYADAAMSLHTHVLYPNRYYPKFNEAMVTHGITADQAREAAHLLNQLAEWIDNALPNKADKR